VTRIQWSPRSIGDLDSIRDFIALDSPLYADLVVRRLVAAAGGLSRFPKIGRIIPELGVPQLRERIVPPFRIVYRFTTDLVEIVTIFRSSRQFPSDLG
jgi:plasmid stabilization system protein ParE